MLLCVLSPRALFLYPTTSSEEYPSLAIHPREIRIIKIQIHSSCEIEYFVENHLCKLAVCDTPIARIASCVSSLSIFCGQTLGQN